MTEMNKFETMINGKPEERVGDLVGNYRIIRWLGRGAFADVYLGEHIYLKIQSAIKMLHVHLSEKAQKVFLNEACTIARLDHPNIVRILDYGVENGTPFLVMAEQYLILCSNEHIFRFDITVNQPLPMGIVKWLRHWTMPMGKG